MALSQNYDGWRITSFEAEFKAERGSVYLTVSHDHCSKCHAKEWRQSVKSVGMWSISIQFCQCGKFMQISEGVLCYTSKVRSVSRSRDLLRRFAKEYHTPPYFIELLVPFLPMIGKSCRPELFFR